MPVFADLAFSRLHRTNTDRRVRGRQRRKDEPTAQDDNTDTISTIRSRERAGVGGEAIRRLAEACRREKLGDGRCVRLQALLKNEFREGQRIGRWCRFESHRIGIHGGSIKEGRQHQRQHGEHRLRRRGDLCGIGRGNLQRHAALQGSP